MEKKIKVKYHSAELFRNDQILGKLPDNYIHKISFALEAEPKR